MNATLPNPLVLSEVEAPPFLSEWLDDAPIWRDDPPLCRRLRWRRATSGRFRPSADVRQPR